MPKLAEALVERKALQERLTRLHARLAASARVQEGDSPAEQPGALIEEAGRVLADIKRLTIAINRTNLQAALPGSTDGSSLMEAIAERDRLRDERHALEQLNEAARIEPNRGYGMTRNEIKWKATIDVADLQKQIDALSQSYRLLDTRIQEANWSIDLIQN
jgi:hypothetical protein